MERQDKILRYEKGESISSIARAAGVSRQAIIRCLQRVGVHTPGKAGRPATELKPDNKPIVKVDAQTELKSSSSCRIDSVPDIDLTKLSSSPKRIGRNLYATNTHYIVKFFDNNKLNEYKYSTRQEVLNAYNL